MIDPRRCLLRFFLFNGARSDGVAAAAAAAAVAVVVVVGDCTEGVDVCWCDNDPRLPLSMERWSRPKNR